MSFVCHSYVPVFHLYVTCLCSFVIRMLLVCTRMSSVCHSYVLAWHPYVTRTYSYVIGISLISTRMSSVCHLYVLVYHLYVSRMWFSHEPNSLYKVRTNREKLKSTWLIILTDFINVIKSFKVTLNSKQI